MPQLNPVQSAARIAHLGARPGAPVFAERLAERKSRRHIESYRLVTSFKRASIIATQFVNPAADGKGKSRGDGIVLTAGYGNRFVHIPHGAIRVTKKPFGVPGENARVHQLVVGRIAVKILFATLLNNLSIEFAGSGQIAKTKARECLHRLRGDERQRATAPMGDREHLIGQGQRRARLAPQTSADAQSGESIYRISAA